MDFHGNASHLSPHDHSQYSHPQGAGSPAYPQYPHNPALEHSSAGDGRLLHPSASPHMHAASPQQMPASFNADATRSTITPSTPSHTASPRFNTVFANRPPSQAPEYAPTDRSLPSRDLSANTIDDAYAAFILYCNPGFPPDIETAELKKAFKKPPMSDNKLFDTWNLFLLIKRFDENDIKTWTALALELGVEPPAIDKGQSTQKVQQYSVRLKRWMRAMHIDAFFEYLLGKQHPYLAQIPPPHDAFPASGRDGVPLEEDLALRTLDPKFRPKRGRRKAEDMDIDTDQATPPPKRPSLDTSFAFSGPGSQQSAYPSSAVPMSARPDELDRFSNNDPWTAATMPTPHNIHSALQKGLDPRSALTTPGGQQLRWRLNNQDTPSTPHPLSAITPVTSRPPDSAFDEPMSAITPSSRSRSKRRHGPAVSSAWPSNSGSSGGKLRGRPPSNRSVRDGPYVTFPANPRMKEAPVIELGRATPGPTPGPTPIYERAQSESSISIADGGSGQGGFRFPPTPASAVSISAPQRSLPAVQAGPGAAPPPPQARSGHRLSLQVPQHTGGPVHLVTPTLLVNGDPDPSPGIQSSVTSASQRTDAGFSDGSVNGDDMDHTMQSSHPPAARSPHPYHALDSTQPTPSPTHEDLKRALAADLLRADMRNRSRLSGSEAKALADALLRRLRTQHQQQQVSRSGPRSPGTSVDEAIFRTTCASWLGISAQLQLGGSNAPVGGTKKISVQRFRVGKDGYESPIDDGDAAEARGGGARVSEVFDVSWNLLLGGCAAEFAVKGLSVDVVGEEEGVGEKESSGVSGAVTQTDLKWRVAALEEELRRKSSEVQRLKDRVLDAVL